MEDTNNMQEESQSLTTSNTRMKNRAIELEMTDML